MARTARATTAKPASPARPKSAPVAQLLVRAGGTRQASPLCLYSTSVEGDMTRLLGRPHYSYRFAEAKFLASFVKAGLTPALLRMPEYYATRQALPPQLLRGHADSRLLHFIFRSTEQIRVLHPGYNIACYAWEFEVLKDWTAVGEHPFANQTRMLALCDEVWVPCRFTRDVLQRYGIGNVHVVPAPLAMPTTPRPSRAEALTMIGQVSVMPLRYNFLLSGTENARAVSERLRSLIDWLGPRFGRGSRPLVYLAVLNPDDFRKNIDSLLRGFHYFHRSNPRAVLIVKTLTSPDRRPLDRVIAELIPNKLDAGSVFDTDAIVFFAAYLSTEEMRALYCIADFYLSTSMAEGQNLPLLEAMAEGTVPISTVNTAMRDYIDPDNAFVIASRPIAAQSEHLAGAVAGRPYKVDYCGPQDVYQALMRSARARAAELRAKASAAQDAVRRGYSHEAVWPALAARLDPMGAPHAAAK